MKYQIELKWNREFHFVSYGQPILDLNEAIKRAKELENMGDGERVKSSQIVDEDGEVVWQYGKKVK